jgi:hypothetical protein
MTALPSRDKYAYRDILGRCLPGTVTGIQAHS